jgi:hypothetical protein
MSRFRAPAPRSHGTLHRPGTDAAGAGAEGLPPLSQTAPSGTSGSSHIQTAAYVIERVDKALGAAGQDAAVSYVRTSYPAGTILKPIPDGLTGTFGNPPVAVPHQVSVIDGWSYDGRFRLAAFTATGQRLFGEVLTKTAGTETTIAISYSSGTWWRAVTPAAGTRNPASGCTSVVAMGPPDDWPAFIRHELACGNYAIDGHERVDGADAIKISAVDQGKGPFQALWVDSATYLPVRITLTMGSPTSSPATREDFRWLPASTASLGNLNAAIPSGFRQVSPPSP